MEVLYKDWDLIRNMPLEGSEVLVELEGQFTITDDEVALCGRDGDAITISADKWAEMDPRLRAELEKTMTQRVKMSRRRELRAKILGAIKTRISQLES